MDYLSALIYNECMTTIEPIRIFVGADRSQWLATQVLEYSIKRRSSIPVTVTSMAELELPRPKSKNNQPRTGFSFARFAIPALAHYEGRALYVDADMLVLRDIAELWSMKMNGHLVQIQGGDEERRGERPKQCSVMILDCARLNWKIDEIVAGLDGQYNYADLMYQLCILPEGAIGYDIPFAWNSLEYYDNTTGLIHYTDMLRQPWVVLNNPNRAVWTAELRDMLAEGKITEAEIAREIELGYARPSLLPEIKGEQNELRLHDIDKKAEFLPHGGFVATSAPFFTRLKRKLFG